ncbi:MAG: IPT/TIG domain-containing protein, partial [Acidobacteriota bacterium]
GSADAGEVVELVVHLINRYGASNDVEAILTTSAPGLATVRTDLFTSPVLYDAFGPLSSCNVACDNHRRNTAEPFVVEIDASASTHLNIPFSLQLTETSVDPYTTDLVFNLRSNTSAEVVRGAYPIHLLDGEHARFVSATPKQADLDGDTLPDLLQAEYDLPSNWSGIPVFVRAHDANGSQVFDQVAIEALIREPLAVGDLGATLGGGKMIAFAEVDLPAVGAIRPDGTSLFRHEIPNTSSRFSSPALGDIDGDGENEVIAVLSGIIGAAAYEDPAVYAFEANGAMLSGFPVVIDGLSQKAPPALGDLDNDGLPEIVVSTVDSEILVVDGTGFIGPEWPVDLADGALGAPVLGDLDGENGLDIVVAGKHSVHALTSDGTLRPGFPILMDAALEFDTQLSPLALGDIEDDGTLEIALTRRQLYLVGPFGRHLRNDVFLLGLDATGAGEIRMGPATISEDGTIGAQYHPVDWRYASSPTLADVDDDGTLELLVSEVRGLHVLNADGTDYSSAELSSPIPLIEQVQVGTNPHGFSHRYENLYGVERSPKFLAPPSATDIDGDDTVELAMASRSKRSHLLRTGLPPGRMPWNEVRGDSENTAALPSSSCPVATITSLSPSVGSNLTDVDVTITGTGFRSTVEVHLGDIRVPAVHVSSTTIVMTVPSGFMEGLHDLRLEFAEIDGCSIRASRADAYESLPDFQPPVLIPDVYVSTASDDRVKHFNLAVPVVSGAISVGDNPSRIDMSADGRFVYALNTDSQDVSMIRTADNLEIDTSPLPGFQRLPAGVFSFGLRVSDVAGVGSLIGTVSAGTSTLTVIDEASAADPTTPPVVATLSLPIPNAFDLAFDREGQGLIFITSAGAGELAVVDASAFPALSLVDVHAFSAIGGLGRVLTTPGGEFLFTCSISVNRMNRIDLTTAPPTLESRTITPGHDLFSGELTLYAEAERVFASGGLNRVQQASVEPYFVVPRTVPGSGVLHGGDELGPDGRIQLFASPIGLVQQLDMENLSGGPIQTIFMPGGPSDVAVGPTSEGPLILSLEPDSRAANCPSQSVLRGAFFQPGARVWVGDVECTVRFVSHTYLELTIPDGLPDGTYDVTVRNPDGQSETLPAGYTVDSSLTPTPEVRVNAATAGTQTALGIATTASEDPALAGRHAVLYFDASTGDYDTWLKVYDRDGTVVVPDTKVNPDPGLGSGGGDLTIDGDGRVTVVWSESYLDGLGEYRQDVFLKRYLANGAPDPLTVPELRVNQQAASDKYSSNPTVSADLDGNLLVAWQRHNGGGFQPKVFGRRFDAGLAGLDPPASINCGTFAHGQEFCIDLVAGFHPQSDLEPDARGDGRFVITATQLHLSKHRIIARAFDFADGEPLDDLFSATDEPTINHWRSEVAVDHDGGWIIAWQRTPSGDLSTRDYEVRAKRYDENGDSVTPQFPVVGDQFQVNDFTAEDQVAPSIAVSATGDFTISWLSRQDTAFSLGCYAKRYTRDAVEVPPPCEAWVGTAIGNEFQVNTLIAGDQYQLRVSSDPLGDLNFGWAGWDPSTSGSEAWVRRLDREGLPR